jgi:cysteine synthase A
MSHLEALRGIIERPVNFVDLASIVGVKNGQVQSALEYEGVGGSHKDRAVAEMIHHGIGIGAIREGTRLVIYTTGSAGNSTAAIARNLGLDVTVVMPSNITIEREKLIRDNGAELVLTAPDHVLSVEEISEGVCETQIWVKGATLVAARICAEVPNSYLLNQSVDPYNPAAFSDLGRQISEKFDGNLDYFVAASGTGATIVGVAEALKKQISNVQIVAVDVDKSAQTWSLRYAQKLEHQPHKLYGTGPGGVSQILQKGISLIDEVVRVDDEEAYEVCREMVRSGLSVGPTSGANVLAIRSILKENPAARIATIFFDRADRYKSVGL